MLIVQMLAGAAPPPPERVYRDVNARITTRGISYNFAAQKMLAVFLDLCKTLNFTKSIGRNTC